MEFDGTEYNPGHCPFCKGDFLGYVRLKDYISKACLYCGAKGPLADSKEEADKLWNRRAE